MKFHFRFSKDIDTADVTMRFNLRMVVQQFFRSIAALTLITIQTPIFLLLVMPLAIIYYFVQVSTPLNKALLCLLLQIFIEFSQFLDHVKISFDSFSPS